MKNSRGDPLKPMLAKPFDEKHVKGPMVWLQPKFNGIRCIWDGKQAWTRTGKPILGVPQLVEILESQFDGFPLDGELYAPGVTFQNIISSTRRTVNIKEDIRIGYHVYDQPIGEYAFEVRWAALLTRFNKTKCPRIQLVETLRRNFDMLEDKNPFKSKGFEGTMLRNPLGLYKFGKRSSDLLKIKDFLEEEFCITGVTQQVVYEKEIVPQGTPDAKQYADGSWYKDTNPCSVAAMGALVCQTKDGATFEVGTGFTDEDREKFWKNPPIGEIVTVKFQEYTTSENHKVPRFPVYKALRNGDY